MKLIHYSDKKLKTVNPKYCGQNYFTFNDVRTVSVKRSFFYASEKRENFFKGCYRHETTINKKAIYNITEDKRNPVTDYDLDKALRKIKRLGYKGTCYKIGSLQIVNLFQSIKVKCVGKS